MSCRCMAIGLTVVSLLSGCSRQVSDTASSPEGGGTTSSEPIKQYIASVIKDNDDPRATYPMTKAHYPNFIRDKKKKTRITFIDNEAMREMNSFKQAYENLFDVSYSTFIDTKTGMVRKEIGRASCRERV